MFSSCIFHSPCKLNERHVVDIDFVDRDLRAVQGKVAIICASRFDQWTAKRVSSVAKRTDDYEQQHLNLFFFLRDRFAA